MNTDTSPVRPRIEPTAHLVSRTVPGPLGTLQVLASDKGVRAVLWPGEDGSRVSRSLSSPGAGPSGWAAVEHAERAVGQLRQYFDGHRREFDLELDVVGTPFQVAVWQALRRIPYGATSTYRQQATEVGDPAKARAVGAADGRNPISIIVPCHRVVAASGSLTGFAGGLAMKRWLLDHERRLSATR